MCVTATYQNDVERIWVIGALHGDVFTGPWGDCKPVQP